MNKILENIKKEVLQRDNYTCQKCNFHNPEADELEVHHINPSVFEGNDYKENLITLCSICHKHSPDNCKNFQKYIKEKIDWRMLESFRKSESSISKKTKTGMVKRFNSGQHITKAPKGYKLINKQLIKDEQEAKEINQIFTEFLNTSISLTQLGKKYGFSTAGIKKLLQNSTYIGKVKFANQESDGNHQAIIDKQLFEQVQNKLN